MSYLSLNALRITTARKIDRALFGHQKTGSVDERWNGITFALGSLFGIVVQLLPADLFNRFTFFVARKRGLPGLLQISRTTQKNLLQLQQEIRNQTVLPIYCFTHPETVGRGAPILGEMLSTLIWVHQQLFPQKKLRLLQAIDPFALDTLSAALAGFYSGFIQQAHLGVHRSLEAASQMERFFLHAAKREKIYFRLAQFLNRGDAVALAWGGGVAHNARVFYTLYEALRRWQKRFSAHLNHQHLVDLYGIATQSPESVQRGIWQNQEELQLQEYLEKCGIACEVAVSLVAELSQEWQQSVPTRLRLACILQRLSRKKTVLLIPLRHQENGEIILGRSLPLMFAVPIKKTHIQKFVQEHLG